MALRIVLPSPVAGFTVASSNSRDVESPRGVGLRRSTAQLRLAKAGSIGADSRAPFTIPIEAVF
jgi:hypothetical protein